MLHLWIFAPENSYICPPNLDITLWHNRIVYDKGDIENTTSDSRQGVFHLSESIFLILFYSMKSIQ
jgi:hypothetical protein